VLVEKIFEGRDQGFGIGKRLVFVRRVRLLADFNLRWAAM
jgi:hypothetical protein